MYISYQYLDRETGSQMNQLKQMWLYQKQDIYSPIIQLYLSEAGFLPMGVHENA